MSARARTRRSTSRPSPRRALGPRRTTAGTGGGGTAATPRPSPPRGTPPPAPLPPAPPPTPPGGGAPTARPPRPRFSLPAPRAGARRHGDRRPPATARPDPLRDAGPPRPARWSPLDGLRRVLATRRASGRALPRHAEGARRRR